MAGKEWTETDALIKQLADQPGGHDFFHALRKLQRAWDEHPKIGYASAPAEEPLRLAQEPSLGHKASLIDSFLPPSDGRPARMTLNYHGVFGPNGAIPINYTEYAMDRIRFHRDHTLKDFLDVFHHRMMSLLFRAWADSNITVDLDRVLGRLGEPGSTREGSRYIDYIGSFSGMGMEIVRGRDEVPDFARMYHSHWLGRQARNAEGLEKIISDFFEVPAQVQPFQGRWLPLPENSWCLLGESEETGISGVNAIAGDYFWDCSLSFRVQIGPISFADLQRLLPGGGSFARLCDWIRSYVGKELYWDVQLLIRSEDIPPLELGEGGRIGFDAWLQPAPDDSDFHQVVFDPCGS